MEILETETPISEAIGGAETGLGDVLDTPSLAPPEAQAEIHEGTVIGVTTLVGKDSGNTYGTITLQSKATGKTYEFPFFPPQAWFDPANWTGGVFNAEILSDVAPAGKKQTPREAFAKSVSSSKAAFTKDGVAITEITGKEAPLQLLRKLAAHAGLTLEAGTPRPTNGDEYVGTINALVAGRLEVLFSRRPEKNDNPAFDGQLKVNQIYSTETLNAPNFEKRFAAFRKTWEI